MPQIRWKPSSLKLGKGKWLGIAIAVAVAVSIVDFWTNRQFHITPFGIFTDMVDILLTAIVLVTFGAVPAAIVSFIYWVTTKKNVTTIASTTFWICFGLVAFSSVLSSIQKDHLRPVPASTQSSKETMDDRDKLKAGEILFRSAVHEAGTFPQEYFAEQAASQFAEFMEAEFAKIHANYASSEEMIDLQIESTTSEGEFLSIEGRDALVATVKVRLLEDTKSLWSVNIVGNGQQFGVTQQCIAIREAKVEVLNHQCKEKFIKLISNN